MGGGSGMSLVMGAGCGGGGGESGGGGGGCCERWEPNRSFKDCCFCRMLLEMTRGALVEGGEGCGDGRLGGGDTGALFFSLARASSLWSVFFEKCLAVGLKR